MKQRHLILLLKLLFIAASFAFIFWKADTGKIWDYIKEINPLYLATGYLFMGAAQVISAYRMRFYYSRENLVLGGKFSIGLYFTSMLFNTVLPGGIGGDGYKIYTIGKFANFPHLRAFKIAISERASGLFALLLLTSLFYVFADFPPFLPYQNYIIAALTLLVVPAYFISTSLLLKEKLRTALGATAFSIPIQLLNAAIALILIIGLEVQSLGSGEIACYVVIFMASSVAAILPLSVGGVGIREITFFYGAKLAGLSPELGVSVAMLFFIISTASSLNGLFFWHKLHKLYTLQPA